MRLYADTSWWLAYKCRRDLHHATAITLFGQLREVEVVWTPWQRVEATRWALFAAADKSQPDSARYFGNGILKAADALVIAPPRTPTFAKAPPDRVSFPLFRVVTGLALPADPTNRVVNDMLETELAQLTQRHPELEKLLGNHLGLVGVGVADKRRFVQQLLALPDASQTLKTHVRTHQAEILSR